MQACIRAPFDSLQLGGLGLQVIVDEFKPHNVLDVGSGAGEHTRILREYGIQSTPVDFGRSIYYADGGAIDGALIGNFMEMDIPREYDLVWMSHVLEHQPNVNLFLSKARECMTPDGWLAVTVPPLKPEVVGGHLTLWTPGLLIYNLVFAGFDCSDARIMRYGYNITVICRLREAELPELSYDHGDVDRLSAFFPPGCREGFDGWMTDRWWRPDQTSNSISAPSSAGRQ